MPSKACVLTPSFTPILKQLHWLPISQGIIFKLMLIVHKALNGKAPNYTSELILSLHSVKESSMNLSTLLRCRFFILLLLTCIFIRWWRASTDSWRRSSHVIRRLWVSLRRDYSRRRIPLQHSKRMLKLRKRTSWRWRIPWHRWDSIHTLSIILIIITTTSFYIFNIITPAADFTKR